MENSFDPYHSWLGIGDPQRPPNHYRMLGLELFEDDCDAISAAADRQIAHVRTYQLGPQSALSQKLLNELAAAKVCLLDSDKKSAYDRSLGRRNEEERAAASGHRPAAQPIRPPDSAMTLAATNAEISDSHTPQPMASISTSSPLIKKPVLQLRARVRPWNWRLYSTLSSLAVLLVAGLIWGLNSKYGERDSRSTTGSEKPPKSTAASNSGLTASPEPGNDASRTNSPASASQSLTKEPEKSRLPSAFINRIRPEKPVAGETLNVRVTGGDGSNGPVRLEYRLGDTDSWHLAPDGEITLSDLSAGPLQLDVRSVNQSGISSEVVSRVFEVATSAQIRRIAELGNSVGCVAFSPDGRTIAAGAHATDLRLWDATTGKELKRLEGHQSTVHSLCFSQNGQRLLAGDASAIRVWDVPTGKELHWFQAHSGFGLGSPPFSADGRYFLSGFFSDNDRGYARLSDVSTGKELHRFRQPSGITCAAVSSEGSHVLLGMRNGQVRLWNVAAGKEVHTFHWHKSNVYCVAFSPDARLGISGGFDRTVYVWELATGKVLNRIDGFSDRVLGVAFSPHGRYALATNRDPALRLWEVATGQELSGFENDRFDRPITCVAFSPVGHTAVTGGADGVVRLWQLPLENSTSASVSVAARPAGSDPAPPTAKPAAPTVVHHFAEHTSSVFSVALSSDDRYAVSGSLDKSLGVWDLEKGEQVRRFTNHTNQVHHVEFIPNSSLAISSSNDSIRLWDVLTGEEKQAITNHRSHAMGMAVSPDGRHAVSGSLNWTILLWDLLTGERVKEFGKHVDVIDGLAFSPDGTRILSASRDKTVGCWDVATGQKISEFRSHTDMVWFAVFLPDGHSVLSSSRDKTVRLWDSNTGQQLRSFSDFNENILNVAISGNGRRAVVGSGYGWVWVLDVESGAEIVRFKSNQGGSVRVAFSKDGRFILTGGVDGSVRWWQLPDVTP